MRTDTYVSGITNENEYLSFQMALLFFKVISAMFDVFLHTFETIFESPFPFRLWYFQNIHFEQYIFATTASFGVKIRSSFSVV